VAALAVINAFTLGHSSFCSSPKSVCSRDARESKKHMTETTFSLPRAVGSFMVSRFAHDTAMRAPLPFLGAIAVSYGQDASTAGWLSVALSLAGLAAPLTSVLSHRFGQRNMVFWPPLIFVVSCALLPFAPTFGSVLGLFIALSIVKAMSDPQIQAFIAERVPFERRGTVIGVLELSWAFSFVIGAPAFGLLVDRVSWSAPFALLGVIGALGIAAIWRNARPFMGGPDPSASFPLEPWRVVWREPRARLLWLYGLGIMGAAQMPFLVYPIWMRSRFSLSNEQIGFVSIAIGVADVVAEVLVIAFLDRIGKRRAVLAACALYALAFVLFWGLSGTLPGMVAALFCLYLGFEFALVASLSIASEAVPAARTAMMGFFTATSALGRILGALVALPLFGTDRLWLVSLVGCISVLSSLVFMALATRRTLGSSPRLI
jgi:predicted MFS family arabinose efflux permease